MAFEFDAIFFSSRNVFTNFLFSLLIMLDIILTAPTEIVVFYHLKRVEFFFLSELVLKTCLNLF